MPMSDIGSPDGLKYFAVVKIKAPPFERGTTS